MRWCVWHEHPTELRADDLNAQYGNVNDGKPYRNWNNRNNDWNNIRFRPAAVIRNVYLAEAVPRLFNQPPAIRPISCRSDCAWNTLVSLTSFISKYSRSFNMATSCCDNALIRYPALWGRGAFLARIRFSIICNTVFSRLCPNPWRCVFGTCVFNSTTLLYNL